MLKPSLSLSLSLSSSSLSNMFKHYWLSWWTYNLRWIFTIMGKKVLILLFKQLFTLFYLDLNFRHKQKSNLFKVLSNNDHLVLLFFSSSFLALIIALLIKFRSNLNWIKVEGFIDCWSLTALFWIFWRPWVKNVKLLFKGQGQILWIF